MKHKTMSLSNQGLWAAATSVRIAFQKASNNELLVWSVWFSEHQETEYTDLTQRHWYNINRVELKTELAVRRMAVTI